MNIKKTKGNNEKDEYIEQYRSFPLWALLICGVILCAIGFYFFISDSIIKGTTLPGRSGTGGGKPIYLNGVTLMILGVLISAFPTVQLIKKSRNKP